MHRRTIAELSSAFLFVVAATGSRIALQRRTIPPPITPVAFSLPTGHLRAAALSFSSAAADLLWIRFVQDIPLAPADERIGQSLASELRAVVALDPTFRAPYVQGSVLLSVLGSQPCASLQILESGIPRFPDDWRLSFQAGYECFSELGDSECAARHMQRAAQVPGSPSWLPGLVARLLGASHRSEVGVELLQATLANPRLDPRLRPQFEERLRQARLSADLEKIDDALRKYRAAHDGSAPDSLETLVAEGMLARLPPQDPLGGHYVLGENGRARSSTGAGRLLPSRIEGGGPARDPIEKLLPERVAYRLPEMLGHDPSLLFETDRVLTAGGVLVAAAQGAVRVFPFLEDPNDRRTLLDRLARTVLAWQIDRLRKTQLALVRANPEARPSLQDLVSFAGVGDHDPFGSKFVLDVSGAPAPAAGRHPMVNVRGSGAAACQ